METELTNQEWILENNLCIVPQNRKGLILSTVNNRTNQEAQSLAVGKVMAASSKMLKALKRVKVMFDHTKELTGDYGNENLYLEVISAIKKATE